MLQDLLDRISLAEWVVGAVAILAGLLIIAAAFDFNRNEVAEIVVTGALAAAVLGAFAALAHLVGVLLERLDPPREEPYNELGFPGEEQDSP
jgi:hypothetical protein